MRYDKSIDRIRGLLVLLMIYAHVLQFFGNVESFPAVLHIINTINVLVFPSFVFCLGRSAAAAYLQKPFRTAAPRLIRMALSLYGVFVLSGLGFRLLKDRAPFNTVTVGKILLLRDIPGWSEFLAGFAAYALILLVLFKPLQWLSSRFTPTLIMCGCCLALCFLPYELVKSPQIGLLIGSRDFACFPAVQYAPYLLAGLYWQATRKHGLAWVLIGLGATAAGIAYTAVSGLPERFPPSLPWVLLTGFFPVAASFLSSRVSVLPRYLDPADTWLRNAGRRSLFYLLASNLTLFALSGSGIAPILTKRDIWFWKQPVGSPLGALLWTAVLIIAIGLAASLAGRSSEKQIRTGEKAAAGP